MNAGLAILEPKLAEVGNVSVGKAVIGTVKGDLHDIGKNLVSMMLKGAGFEVVDLGVDVGAEQFVERAEEVGADIICISALLTTTMSNMKSTIDLLNEKGIRDKYIVMVGGAPVNDNFAKQIGADYYAADAATAATVAKQAIAQ
jgi:5-methyltetrahydrofolate--homocysteine methyltransferase